MIFELILFIFCTKNSVFIVWNHHIFSELSSDFMLWIQHENGQNKIHGAPSRYMYKQTNKCWEPAECLGTMIQWKQSIHVIQIYGTFKKWRYFNLLNIYAYIYTYNTTIYTNTWICLLYRLLKFITRPIFFIITGFPKLVVFICVPRAKVKVRIL